MKNLLVVCLCAGLFMSCADTRETPSGQKFTVVRAGDGVPSKTGEILVMNFLFKDSQDSVWNDTRKNPFPLMVMIQDSVVGGDPIQEVFKMLTKGDSVTLKVKAQTLFEKSFQTQLPAGISADADFTFEIGVIDLMSDMEARQYQTEIVNKQNAITLQAQMEQLAKDTVLIDDHLKGKALTAQTTKSGLRYIITKPGTGENAKSGQTVRVNYSGYLLDGTCFDSSIEEVAKANNVYNEMRAPYEPIEVVLGTESVIPGWEEALLLMNKGSKMTVFIPSTLAYGNRKRSDIIIENSILKFDMEMVDIK